MSWPFLIEPHQFLYIRYFDADTIFGPQWKLHDLLSVWSSQLHLGYTHARDLSYISLQELISVALTPLGPDFRNRSSLIAISLGIFFAFWCFARVRFAEVPGLVTAVAAFFYATNPFVVAFIHDGYSGLLVDYALLPVSLMIVEWARRRNTAFLSFIPVLFLITGMYNLTSVLIALLGTVILEYRFIMEALRRSRVVVVAVALGFTLNVYWVVPLAYDLAIHPKQPILAESAGDIAALTSAGTLSNVLLLRSYPEIWTKAYGTPECVGCAFYESPWFEIAMVAIVAFAVAGLIRSRRYAILAALAGSLLLATGYHYQNEIIGIPYVILMSLPTFDAFRSNVKFSALTIMFYSLGLLYFYAALPKWRKAFGIAVSMAALVVAMPYVTGNMIERSPDQPPHFPNFVVSIPSYYRDLYRHRDLLLDQAPTLLLPNTPFGAYAWGAYGNDFVPAYLAKPTLSVSYLPQPSSQLELILQRLTDQRTDSEVRKALLRSLGISRSLYRDDTAQSRPLPMKAFGSEIATFGALHVLSASRVFPPFFVTQKSDPVVGVTGIATYAGLWDRASHAFGASDQPDVCAGSSQLGIEPIGARRRGMATIDVPLNCDAALSVMLAFRPQATRGVQIVNATNGRPIIPKFEKLVQAQGAVSFAAWKMPPGPHRYIVRAQRASDILLAAVGHDPSGVPASGYSIRSVQPKPFAWLGYEFESQPFEHYLVFNENFDPTWQGLVRTGGRWHRLSNLMVDGFANAWKVPQKAPLIVLNVLQLLVWLSAAVAILVLLAYICVLRLACRSPVR